MPFCAASARASVTNGNEWPHISATGVAEAEVDIRDAVDVGELEPSASTTHTGHTSGHRFIQFIGTPPRRWCCAWALSSMLRGCAAADAALRARKVAKRRRSITQTRVRLLRPRRLAARDSSIG